MARLRGHALPDGKALSGSPNEPDRTTLAARVYKCALSGFFVCASTFSLLQVYTDADRWPGCAKAMRSFVGSALRPAGKEEQDAIERLVPPHLYKQNAAIALSKQATRPDQRYIHAKADRPVQGPFNLEL
jgi:hypothetical protein